MTWRGMDRPGSVLSVVLSGVVEGIFVAAAATDLPVPVDRVEACVGLGLNGDRYAAGVGTYSSGPKPGRQVTLIEAEALDRLFARHGMALTPGAARRNIVTRGVNLASLIGCHFTIG